MPFDILPGQIFDLAPSPSPAQLLQLVTVGEQVARQERIRLGLLTFTAAPPPGGMGVAAAVGGAATAMPPMGATPPGGGVGLPEGPAGLAHAAGRAGGALAPADGAHFGVGCTPAGGAVIPVAGLPLGGVALVFGGAAAASAVFGGDPGGYGIAGGGFSQEGSNNGDEARTLPIVRDNEVMRFSDFREATKKSRPSEFTDLAIAGPRITKLALGFISEHRGTPLGHHQALTSTRRLQPVHGPRLLTGLVVLLLGRLVIGMATGGPGGLCPSALPLHWLAVSSLL